MGGLKNKMPLTYYGMLITTLAIAGVPFFSGFVSKDAILAGVLGGIAGCLAAASVGVISPLLVLPLTVKGLVVTVIGGLGSIRGAIIAGLLVGVLECVFLLLRGVNERDIYVFLLLFVFLVFRPNGFFGAEIDRD